jgi:hypothetical protein
MNTSATIKADPNESIDSPGKIAVSSSKVTD